METGKPLRLADVFVTITDPRQACKVEHDLGCVLNWVVPDMPYSNEAKEIVDDQWDSEGLFTLDEIWSYPDFWAESGWIERCCEMTSGNGLNNCCLARPVIGVLRRRTIGGSSRRFSGSCVPAVRGATCLLSLDIGTGRMCGFRAGARRAYSSASPKSCAVMRTWNTSSSIRPSCVPTNILLAPKKSRWSGNRPFAGRTDDQTACGGRCLGQSAARDSLGGADYRHRLRGPDHRAPARTRHRRRQGLRCRSLHCENRSIRCASRYPASIQSAASTKFRSPSLQRPQSDRAFLRAHQALPTHRHSIRQTGFLFSVVRSSGLRLRLVGLNENTP